MRQRRPAPARHNRNQCASGAGGNAGDFGNRHRKIQGPPFASTDPTYDRDAKFLGAPRRLPFVIKSLGAFLGARLKEIPASEHGQNKVRRGKREIGLDAEMLENSEEIKLPEARIICCLEFTNELAVAIGKAVCPILQHFAHAATGASDGSNEVLV